MNISKMDYILFLAHGEIVHFGLKEDVIAAIQQSTPKPAEQKPKVNNPVAPNTYSVKIS